VDNFLNVSKSTWIGQYTFNFSGIVGADAFIDIKRIECHDHIAVVVTLDYYTGRSRLIAAILATGQIIKIIWNHKHWSLFRLRPPGNLDIRNIFNRTTRNNRIWVDFNLPMITAWLWRKTSIKPKRTSW